MDSELERLRAVLNATEALLAAHEHQMLTNVDWDGLQHLVAAMQEPPPDERDETFAVEGGALVRRVVPRKGQPYEHRCPQEDVRRAAEITWTEAAVAVAFLKERGCVVPAHGRKHVAASGTVFEDAMTEYHALYEER